MNKFEMWSLRPRVSIAQAALYVLGCDPDLEQEFILFPNDIRRPPHYAAIHGVIASGVRSGQISGATVPHYRYDDRGNKCEAIENSFDQQSSLLDLQSVIAFFMARGITLPISARSKKVTSLSRNAPELPPKLRAANDCFTALEGKHPKGRTAKQTAVVWLRAHARVYGLIGRNGQPNGKAIGEIAKIINWNPKGGAPKTPAQ